VAEMEDDIIGRQDEAYKLNEGIKYER